MSVSTGYVPSASANLGNGTIGHGGAAAGGHTDSARLAMFSRRTRMNHESMIAFLIAMVVLALFIMLFHFVHHAMWRFGAKGPSYSVGLSRYDTQDFSFSNAFKLMDKSSALRRALLRKVPTLPSAGHATLIFLYLAINVVVTFTNMDNNNMAMNPNLASRTGWMAMGNLALLVLLGLKNTPLSLFTSWSYERLNILHQVAGYTTIAFVIIHLSCYSSYFVGDGRPERLLVLNDIYGIVAATAFVVLGFAGAVIRRWWYELFYYLHVGFWILAIVMTGLHQPEVGKNIIIITVVAASMWLLDRLVRVSRLIFYSFNNTATLTPLPNGGTRVRLAKPPVGAETGKHCFLWIPALRSFESHPFTIASMDPLEFVVASYDGFTRDLHKYAVEHPGVCLKASVEGSYGAFPDAPGYDKVVLVSGGSGASFTFGVALRLIKRLADNTGPQVEFIWVVKKKSYLNWFPTELDTLERSQRISLKVFVTRGTVPKMTGAGKGSVTMHYEAIAARSVSEDKGTLTTAQSPASTTASIDPEKSLSLDSGDISPMTAANVEWDVLEHIGVTYARPNVGPLIRDAVNEMPVGKSVLVMGCGPEALMTEVRNTTARCIRADGPVVELHCERFGW